MEMDKDNQLNVLTIEGALTSDVRLTYDDTRKISIAKFYLKNTSRVGQNTYYNDCYVVVYGKKAEGCAEHLCAGDTCTVTGKVSTWQKTDKHGNPQPGITLIASDVYYNKKQ